MVSFKNGLGKDPNTGTWLYCFKVNGKICKGSTRAKDRPTALRILAEKRKGVVLEQQGLQGHIPTVNELAKIWQTSHLEIHSQSHLRSVEGIIRLWVAPLIGEIRIDRVTTSMIEEARQGILNSGRSPVTANLMVRSVRLLWRFALRLGYIENLPFVVHQMKVQRKPRPVLSIAVVKDFFRLVEENCRNPQIVVMLKVMVGLGLRQSEALGMRWEWFSQDQRTYTVGKAKGKDARVLPIPTWLWDAIHSMPKTLSAWVFPAKDGKPHRNNFLTKPIAIGAMKLKLGHLTQHRLRATFATLHAQAGTPITEIQSMLGHKCITTTMIYIETNLDAKRRAQDVLSEKLGLA